MQYGKPWKTEKKYLPLQSNLYKHLSSCCPVVVQWITVQQTKNNRGTIEQQWKVNMMGGKVKTKLI